MASTTLFVLLLATLTILIWRRAPIAAMALLAVGLPLGPSLATGLSPALWLAAVLPAAFVLLAVPKIRVRLISMPMLRRFKRALPPLSKTESEALLAGAPWWDAELFSGRPNWDALLQMPASELSAREQAFLDGPVEILCRKLDDWRITHETLDLPPDVWRYIKHAGFFGMIVPARYGGLEFSAAAHSAVVMKLASRSITAAVTVMVPNSLGPAKLLLRYGTKTQKNHYLPRLASGREIPCFALTGPDAGSDAGALPDLGRVCHGVFEGHRVLGIRLNWEKRYITLGPIATVIGLAFRLVDPDGLLDTNDTTGITVALIPRDTPGVVAGDRHIPLDIPFQNGPNFGQDVFIPFDWVVGGRAGLGQGWRMLVECLAEGRAISLPALATGAGKLASRYTGAYARVRQQFHQPIGYFEGVEEALARIAALTYQMDAARQLTLAALDCGEHPAVLSAIVKYHLTERYRQVVNDAMDIQGGSAICLGPANLLARVYQAIPIAITVEGANILTRNMIIFGQGAVRCHPFILREMQAAHAADPAQGLLRFDRALLGHVRFILGNMARSFMLGLSRGRLSRSPQEGQAKYYFRQLNWMSAAFALCADATMITLGGALKRRERLSARLGDVLSELYLSSASLKRFIDQGCRETDEILLRWSCDQSLHHIQEALCTLFRNLPSRPLAWALKMLVFPSGLPYTAPSDRLGHQAARLLLEPSAARERLTAGIFIARDSSEKSALLEQALTLSVQSEVLERRLRAAKKSHLIGGESLQAQLDQAVLEKICSDGERRRMLRLARLRRLVIQVDAFSNYGTNHDVVQSSQHGVKLAESS